MFSQFDHFVSYGSTDQKTVRMLDGLFDGLLVPGTIAAFQIEGTKGFVLSLSAVTDKPYVIDSRFPLFQNRLTNPKQSHKMLAEILGVPELVNKVSTPSPSDLSAESLEKITRGWLDFNLQFEDVKIKTFEKYAARLEEEVSILLRKAPKYILPPYAMVGDQSDNWWDISTQLWDRSKDYGRYQNAENNLRRVIAAKDPVVWNDLASQVHETEIVAWVSNLNEFEISCEENLKNYGHVLLEAKTRGQKIFALYGGFFSVLLSKYGLTGASHGIGYGEHRNWIELPTSGAAPARYYVPLLHRYLPVDLARRFGGQFPELISCQCEECQQEPPFPIEYHALMRHSVRIRHQEIEIWKDLPKSDVLERLRKTEELFDMAINKFDAPNAVVEKMRELYSHLSMWVRVIETLP